jgi:hypothetical protein
MKSLAHNPMPFGPVPGRGIVCGEQSPAPPSAETNSRREPSARLKRPQTRRGQTDISIRPEAVFSDSAIRGLIDDWIVPMLVEKFIDSRLVKQSPEEKETS